MAQWRGGKVRPQPAPALLCGRQRGFRDCLQRGKGNFGLAAVFAYKIASFSAVGQAVFRLENIRCEFDAYSMRTEGECFGLQNS